MQGREVLALPGDVIEAKPKLNCPVKTCPAKRNSKKCVAQVLYIFIATVALLSKRSEFSRIAISLLVIPTMIDLVFMPAMKTKPLQIIKYFFIGLGIILMLASIFTIANILVIDVTEFSIKLSSEFLVGAGKGVSLWWIIGGLFAHCVVPFMFYIGTPDLRTHCKEAGIECRIDILP